MTSTPNDAGATREATEIARELIASYGQDPDCYVSGFPGPSPCCPAFPPDLPAL